MKPVAFNCGHPTSRDNTQEISARYPFGRCRYCRVNKRRNATGVTKPRVALDRPRRSDAGSIRSGTETHFGCGHARLANTKGNGTPNGACRECDRKNARIRRERPDDLPAPRHLPRFAFELVSVQPVNEAQSGRSYSSFPLKQQRMA